MKKSSTKKELGQEYNFSDASLWKTDTSQPHLHAHVKLTSQMRHSAKWRCLGQLHLLVVEDENSNENY